LQVSATVNVPRGYFVGLYKAANPEEEDAPDDAAIQPFVDTGLAQIQEQVENILGASQQRSVKVFMFPDETVFATGAVTAGPGGLMALVEAPWAKPAGAVALALVSLGLMFRMVRNATAPENLPSVEELAGLPPVLPTEEDLVGEVEEQEASMAGVELDEAELNSRRIAEQISEMIRSDPNEAGQLLGKWVRTDDY